MNTKAEGSADAVQGGDVFEWALQRVTAMCASALVDASIHGKRLLKGFGYPNEAFGRAQDHRALRILLDALHSGRNR
jgi:hypothetical protein